MAAAIAIQAGGEFVTPRGAIVGSFLRCCASRVISDSVRRRQQGGKGLRRQSQTSPHFGQFMKRSRVSRPALPACNRSEPTAILAYVVTLRPYDGHATFTLPPPNDANAQACDRH